MEELDENVMELTPAQEIAYNQGLSQHIARTYGLMGAGLAVTAIVSWLVYTTGVLESYMFSGPLFIALLLAELGLVVLLSARIKKMSQGEALTGYFFYTLLSGLTFSVILYNYTSSTVFTTFFITAGMFGSISLYGLLTKRDLSGWGSILYMGVIGIVLAIVVNWFWQNTMFDLLISAIGVIVFSALTAYDSQMIKRAYDGTYNFRTVTMGALKLYLDFVNMFLFLLRLFGGRD